MKVSVVGLGKLGSPFAAVLASKGHEVIGIDLNQEIVRQINEGKAPFEEPQLQKFIQSSRPKLSATTNYTDAIFQTDATFIIVPTPSESNGFFSNRYIIEAMHQIGRVLKEKNRYHLVVVTSTVMPGSMSGEILAALEKSSQRKLGKEFGLCYSPEFIALGSVIHDMLFPDLVLIGESDQHAGNILESIYKTICENDAPIRRMNFVNAELTKLAINTFITTKISYANMLAGICENLVDSDAWVVTQTVGLDSRIGKKYLQPAVAFGGPCFPRDNFAFKALADRLGARSDIAEATQHINRYQPERLRKLVRTYTEENRIGIIGLSYKPGTNVVECSPGIELANLLSNEGYEISVYDPCALNTAKKLLHPTIQLAESLETCFAESELVLLMTPWPEFKNKITPKLLKETKSCRVIIDCWRILPIEAFDSSCQIVHLGKYYFYEEEESEFLAKVLV